MRRLLRNLANLVVLAAITTLMLEGALRLAVSRDLIPLKARVSPEASFYRDENPRFGVWHPPNARYVARKECFEVEYRSNSWGARDRERTLASDSPRVVVLGDSFVEGVGVAQGRRLTDLLEAETGVEHLNFGTAANFSSVQEWLLYEDLASRFDHDLVLLFTLPDNDFLENDPHRWWQPDRYRPYLRRVGDRFEVFYPFPFEEMPKKLECQVRWNRLYNAFFVIRLFDWARTQVRVRLALRDTTEFGHVGYVSHTEPDLERLFYSYRRLRDAAGGREVVVFTIPRLTDLLYLQKHRNLGELAKRIADFAIQEPHLRYFDLAPGFLAHAERHGVDLADYFLPCDGHWSELGHRVAGILVRDLLNASQYDGGTLAPVGVEH